MSVAYPFARPLYMMVKPAGPRCNLRCGYCYYLEKSRLYGDAPVELSDTLLEKFVREYIQAQTTPEVLFTWHGGEPLLRPLSFYRRVLRLQRLYAGGRRIDNCIQTNGMLLTDEWCRFFHDHGFLVGISIDGPRLFHDAFRRRQGGQGTFDGVMHAVRMLDRHQVEWNAMAVVNSMNVQRPLEFYRFFRDMGCRYLQFTPVVERLRGRADGLSLSPGMQGGEEGLTDFSVTPDQWGDFLCRIFDEWVQHDVGTVFVQLFDATLANWVGEMPGVCSLSPYCGHVGVMESNGDVYSCDHFVYPEYLLGNLNRQTITEMMYSDRQRRFSMVKTRSLPRQCRECRYGFACYGECPKNRFLYDAYGDYGLNWLCRGYFRFFDHVAPYMDFMAGELSQGRPPANVMGLSFLQLLHPRVEGSCAQR